MTTHLDAAWLANFDSSPEDAKRQLLSRLLDDWLHGTPPNVDHCSAALELLWHAKDSAARRSLIEADITEGLVSALGVPNLSASAARAAARFAALYPSGCELLAERLAAVLAAPGASPLVLNGVERLAGLSQPARARIMPMLLDAAIAALLDGHKSFDSVGRGFELVGKLRGCLETTPYQAALDTAFGSA